jgi:hypothetical protein
VSVFFLVANQRGYLMLFLGCVWIEHNRNFHVRVGRCRSELPLLDRFLRAVSENGASADYLGVLDCSVCQDEGAQLYRAANSPLAQDAGVLRGNLFDDFAGGLLRGGKAGASEEKQNKNDSAVTQFMYNSSLHCKLSPRSQERASESRLST